MHEVKFYIAGGDLKGILKECKARSILKYITAIIIRIVQRKISFKINGGSGVFITYFCRRNYNGMQM